MVRFDIVGALRTLAATKGWHFILGENNTYEYASADQHEYQVDELVLVCSLNPIPNFSIGGAIQGVRYDGFLMLGRKFEATTMAELDETMIQKHDNRLLDLWTILCNEVGVFACSNRLDVSINSSATLPNMLSTNIDFVYLGLNFTE